MQIQTSQHLKILLISHSSDLGGGQKGLLYLLDQLMSMGHQCSVLVPKEHGASMLCLGPKGAWANE